MWCPTETLGVFESFEGAQVSAAGARLADAQKLRRLGVVELLEVAQGQHFAVHRLHAVDRFLQAELHLRANGGFQGRGSLAQELCGQACRTRFGHGALVNRQLTGGIAGLRAQMMPPQFQQFLTGQDTQPEKERHSRVAQVLRQAFGGFQVRFLNHVARIDAALQARIETQADHAAQPVAVRFQHLTQRLHIALSGAAQQV
jgi:hypothetical protein